jgi:hypothetical protein
MQAGGSHFLASFKNPPYTRNTVNLVRTGLLLLLALSVLVACDDNDQTGPQATTSPSENDATVVPVTPVDKPAGVPSEAAPVTESEALGQITRGVGGTPEGVSTRQIEDITCTDDVMLIVTDEEVIYAAIECDRVPQGEQVAPYLESEAAIEFEISEERSRVLIETTSGNQAEFTVAGIWVD